MGVRFGLAPAHFRIVALSIPERVYAILYELAASPVGVERVMPKGA